MCSNLTLSRLLNLQDFVNRASSLDKQKNKVIIIQLIGLWQFYCLQSSSILFWVKRDAVMRGNGMNVFHTHTVAFRDISRPLSIIHTSNKITIWLFPWDTYISYKTTYITVGHREDVLCLYASCITCATAQPEVKEEEKLKRATLYIYSIRCKYIKYSTLSIEAVDVNVFLYIHFLEKIKNQLESRMGKERKREKRNERGSQNNE